MQAKRKNLTVLVIEDNEMFRDLAVEMLSGYDVYSASNAIDGIEQFKSHSPNITFIDIGLPDKSGLDVLKQINSIDQNAFMVMLTASNLRQDVQESLKNGARGYIVKPFSRQKIKESIDKYYLTSGKVGS